MKSTALQHLRLSLCRGTAAVLLLGVLGLTAPALTAARQAIEDSQAGFTHPDAELPSAPVEIDGNVLFRVRGASAFPADKTAQINSWLRALIFFLSSFRRGPRSKRWPAPQTSELFFQRFPLVSPLTKSRTHSTLRSMRTQLTRPEQIRAASTIQVAQCATVRFDSEPTPLGSPAFVLSSYKSPTFGQPRLAAPPGTS